MGHRNLCFQNQRRQPVKKETESALLTGAKIPKRPKREEFVSTNIIYTCRKGIRKDIGRIRSERQLL